MKKLLLTLIAAAFSSQAAAGELVFGVGYTDFPGDGFENAPILDTEYRHTPFHHFDGWDISAAAMVSIDGQKDVYFGAGLIGKRRLNELWFVETGSMIGVYFEGIPENDLGSSLEFRHLLAIGRDMGKDHAMSLGITHTSNASLGRFNPGMNTLQLRWHTRY